MELSKDQGKTERKQESYTLSFKLNNFEWANRIRDLQEDRRELNGIHTNEK